MKAVSEQDDEKILLPIVPGWMRRVEGRKFTKFVAMARKNKPAATWGVITTLTDLTYTAFIVPLSMAFNTYVSWNAYTYMDFIGSSVYIMELFAEFHIGFIVKWDAASVIITDGWEVAKNYVRHGTFWIDLIASLPVIGQIILVLIGGATGKNAARTFMLLKLLRLLRVVHLISRIGSLDGGGALSHSLASRFGAVTMLAVGMLFALIVLVNLMASVWWWIAVVQGLENSWVEPVALAKPALNLYDAPNGTRWLVSAYFALVTMTTIGYGDITAVTVSEMVINMVFILTSVAYFGFLLSNVSNLMEGRASASKIKGAAFSQMQNMESWMRRNSFSAKLQRQIRRYHYSNYTAPMNDDEDTAFYMTLPSWLRLKVAMELERGSTMDALLGIDDSNRTAVLGGDARRSEMALEWTTASRDVAVHAIAAASMPVRLARGARLFSAGERAAVFYLLDQGEVSVLTRGAGEPAIVSAPAVLSPMALFQTWSDVFAKYPTTVKAATSCLLWRVDVASLEGELLSKAPHALLSILRNVRQSMIEADARLRTAAERGRIAGVSLLLDRYHQKFSALETVHSELQLVISTAEEAADSDVARAAAGFKVQRDEEEDAEVPGPDIESQELEVKLNRRQVSMGRIASQEVILAAAAGVVRASEAENTSMVI